jgi:hypothetical protein
MAEMRTQERSEMKFYLVGAVASGLPPEVADSIMKLADGASRAAVEARILALREAVQREPLIAPAPCWCDAKWMVGDHCAICGHGAAQHPTPDSCDAQITRPITVNEFRDLVYALLDDQLSSLIGASE